MELDITPLLDIKHVSNVHQAINAPPTMLFLLDADMMKQLLLEALPVQHVEQVLLPRVQKYVGPVTLDGLNMEEKESDV